MVMDIDWDADWDCEAYGEGSRIIGALCFVTGPGGGRRCESADVCHRIMTAERQRVFDHIHARAAQGDPVSIELAREFTDPSQLLGGGEAEPGDGAPDGFR